MPEDVLAVQAGTPEPSSATETPAGKLEEPGLEAAGDGLETPATGQTLVSADGDSASADTESKDAERAAAERGKKIRPTTVEQFFELAYGGERRKLGLTPKDFAAIVLAPDGLEAEMALVRRLAAGDRLLAVPPILLSSIAESCEAGLLRRRLIELAWVALKVHPVFVGQRGGPENRGAENVLLARDVNQIVLQLPAINFAPEGEADVTPAQRERLRVNALTAYLLLQALQGSLTPEQIAREMAALVWTDPMLRGPKAAAVLTAAKNVEALSQVWRQFEAAEEERQRQLANERASVQVQLRRALAAEQDAERSRSELSAMEDRNQELGAQVGDLTQRLGAEQSNRVVDKSHLMDDYEILRTQVIRRLSKQVGLLSDGLHALRNGSPQVAEEFVDRALTAIASEVTRLKESDGGTAT